MAPMDTAQALPRLRWTAAGGLEAGIRVAPEETPVAIVHDGATTAVLMATPSDLEDLGVGFSLTEGIVETRDDIRQVEVVRQADGIEVRLWLRPGLASRAAVRRRRLAGPTGCGLCGVESLAEAVRHSPRVADHGLQLAPRALLTAMDALPARQALGARTRAVHAAGLWSQGAIIAVREDVGRHNALDKLVGTLRASPSPADGVVLLTSRVSVEMIQKAAVLGAQLVCAVSAPTVLAVQLAEACGITLVAVTRADGFEVFSHPHRVRMDAIKAARSRAAA